MSDDESHIKAAYGPQPQNGPWRWDDSTDKKVKMDYCSSYARTRARLSRNSTIVPRWVSILISVGISGGVALAVMSAVTSRFGVSIQTEMPELSVVPVAVIIVLIAIILISLPYLPRMGVSGGRL